MILGIGIDSIEVDRFSHWNAFTNKQLSRVFSKLEIDFCLSAKQLSAERFAVRFAAREAFYKALGHITGQQTVPFLILCNAVTVRRFDNGMPELAVDWRRLGTYSQATLPSSATVHLSLTHTQATATAMVIIEQAR